MWFVCAGTIGQEEEAIDTVGDGPKLLPIKVTSWVETVLPDDSKFCGATEVTVGEANEKLDDAVCDATLRLTMTFEPAPAEREHLIEVDVHDEGVHDEGEGEPPEKLIVPDCPKLLPVIVRMPFDVAMFVLIEPIDGGSYWNDGAVPESDIPHWALLIETAPRP